MSEDARLIAELEREVRELRRAKVSFCRRRVSPAGVMSVGELAWTLKVMTGAVGRPIDFRNQTGGALWRQEPKVPL
jgi:hypothetical protein